MGRQNLRRAIKDSGLTTDRVFTTLQAQGHLLTSSHDYFLNTITQNHATAKCDEAICLAIQRITGRPYALMECARALGYHLAPAIDPERSPGVAGLPTAAIDFVQAAHQLLDKARQSPEPDNLRLALLRVVAAGYAFHDAYVREHAKGHGQVRFCLPGNIPVRLLDLDADKRERRGFLGWVRKMVGVG
jgi:hypothetical protein